MTHRKIIVEIFYREWLSASSRKQKKVRTDYIHVCLVSVNIISYTKIARSFFTLSNGE